MQNRKLKPRARLFVRFATAAVAAVFLLSGCAHKGPLLLDFTYQPPKEAAPAATKAVVAVSLFKDERGKVESLVGRRFLSLNNEANDLVVQGTVAEKVTAALKKALAARGISVQDGPAWDLSEAGIPSTGANLLISGEIKTLWVESVSTLAKTTAKAKVELRIVAADPEQKKIVRILDLDSKVERQSVVYSGSFVGKTLAEALSGALDQIFVDAELKNKLK